MMGGIEMIMMTFVTDKRAFPGTSRGTGSARAAGPATSWAEEIVPG